MVTITEHRQLVSLTPLYPEKKTETNNNKKYHSKWCKNWIDLHSQSIGVGWDLIAFFTLWTAGCFCLLLHIYPRLWYVVCVLQAGEGRFMNS